MSVVEIPSNPVPYGAVSGAILGAGDVALRFARFPAMTKVSRGTVCLFHGRTEFIEKYFETIRDLQQRGFGVATFDWRGQGLSERSTSDPRKGHINSVDEFDRDLERFMTEVALPYGRRPFYALAHSMGGAILTRAAAQNRGWFDRFVLCAPMYGIAGLPNAKVTRGLIRAMRLAGMGTSYVPRGSPRNVAKLPFEGNVLTSDPERYARMRRLIEVEPLLELGSPTVAWLDESFRAMDTIAAPGFARSIKSPMLIALAGGDRVVENAAIMRFKAMAPSVALAEVLGAEHEILMERDRYREQFWAAFDAFIPAASASGG